MVFWGTNKICALTHFLEISASYLSDCSFPLKCLRAILVLHCLRHVTCTDLTVEDLLLRENVRTCSKPSFKRALKPQAVSHRTSIVSKATEAI